MKLRPTLPKWVFRHDKRQAPVGKPRQTHQGKRIRPPQKKLRSAPLLRDTGMPAHKAKLASKRHRANKAARKARRRNRV